MKLTYKSQSFSYIPAINNRNLNFPLPFMLAPPTMNYLGISLTKYVEDLYEENYKTLMKDIKNRVISML